MSHHNQPHISPATPGTASDFTRPSKKSRGSYNCGRCGLPKKGHTCTTATTAAPSTTPNSAASTSAAAPPPLLHQQHHSSSLRRALSFDEIDEAESSESELDLVDLGCRRVPAVCMWEVLSRLPPTGLLAAGGVCKGWREIVKRVWKAVEELKLRVPPNTQIGSVGSVLQKCGSLLKLTLKMESDVDATMLACIAFSCPNLESLEISVSDGAINRITGDELGRFVADKRCLTSLKVEGCSHLGAFVLCSSKLSTLWLSDLHSLSKMIFNCPNLREISLHFSYNDNDCTDLVTMMDGLGRNCPRLQNIHVTSLQLSHAVVLALTAANFRGLRMLSLVLGAEITDASVAAITSSYSKLELLDLSGSSISDGGIGMICNALPGTLSRLLLAVCPNITSSGVQFATAQLPNLELMDCGMSISDASSQHPSEDEDDHVELQTSKLHLRYQKLIIKHSRLKKLSLWGCSALDALYLNCPELSDLNLNHCKNLHPERLLLQCPNIEIVHASGCHGLLVGRIRNQVRSKTGTVENHLPCKRLADGSKRIQAPNFHPQQLADDDNKGRRIESRLCKVIVDW